MSAVLQPLSSPGFLLSGVHVEGVKIWRHKVRVPRNSISDVLRCQHGLIFTTCSFCWPLLEGVHSKNDIYQVTSLNYFSVLPADKGGGKSRAKAFWLPLGAPAANRWEQIIVILMR